MAGFARVLMFAALLVPAATPEPVQSGTVTGQVMNDRGVPVAGVRVAAMPVARDGENSGTLVGLTLTDSNGRYTIETLEPGTYYVTAGRVDAPSYYPGVGSMLSAKSILVTAGARISGIDFRTVQPPTYIVSGRVVLQPGQQLPPGSRISLSGTTSQETPIGPDGTFEFSRVSPGPYNLRLPLDAFSVGMPLRVEDRMTGIEVRLPAGSINANIVMEDASAAPRVSLSFSDIKQNRVMEVVAQRSFVFLVGEGEFRVTPRRVPNGYRVKSLTAGGVDLLSNSLRLSSAQPVASITLTLQTAPAVPFAGRAVSQRGASQPIRSIRMMESAEDEEPFKGTIQPDGSFAFDKIAPGDYTAMVLVEGSQEFKVKITVPPEGRRDADIVIPEVRQLSAKLGVEGNVPASARPVVTLRFIEVAGDVVPLVLDGSAGEAPVKLNLREGQYRVTATIRESATGGSTRVKSMTSGAVNLFTSPLNVRDGVEEIRITIGR
jgi:hypothetical protein